MFNVDANLKHVHTHENNTWRLESALCLFVCSVSLVSSSFDSLHITLWLKCLEFVPHSSRLMHTLTDSLFNFAIHFTFLLFIIFSFQHFLLLFTFLEASRQQPCALPLRSRVPRTTRTPPHKFILEESTRKKDWEHKEGDEFMFPETDDTAKLLRRDYDFRDSTLRQEHTRKERRFQWGGLGESQPTESTDDAGARADWSVQGDFIYRHHNEPRVQLCAEGRNIPSPLKYIDVTRSTHTDLDVMQEKRVDDCWNVDSNRSLSDSRKGFTKSTLLNEKLPKRYMWSGERLTKVQTTTRPAHVLPEVWTKIGKASQNRGKQAWQKEMPKLDNARRLGGIYFIDPDGQDYKETLKNAKRKFARPMDAAMSCKTGSGGDCISQGSTKQSMVVWWTSTNPQGNEWSLLYL